MRNTLTILSAELPTAQNSSFLPNDCSWSLLMTNSR